MPAPHARTLGRVRQAHCVVKDRLHLRGPDTLSDVQLDHRLQIAHLMRQVQLKGIGGRMQLSRPTIAHPDFGALGIHHRLRDVFAATGADLMQHGISSHKHPMPGLAARDPATGFIAMDHGRACHLGANGATARNRRLAHAVQTIIEGSLTDGETKDIAEQLLQAVI